VANDVVVKIPVPENATAKQKHIKVRSGKAKYYPTHNAIVWKFRRFLGSAKNGYNAVHHITHIYCPLYGNSIRYRLQAEVQRLHSVKETPWVRPPITLQFTVSPHAAS